MKRKEFFIILFGLFFIAFCSSAQTVINVNLNEVYSYPTPKYDHTHLIQITKVEADGYGVSVQGYTKDYIKLLFSKKDIIDVTLRVYGYYSIAGEAKNAWTTTNQKFNVKDVNTNVVPNISGMSGPNQVMLGYNEYYEVTPAYKESFIKYEWTVDGKVVGSSKPYLSHTFTKAGYCAISCKATNTLTGVSGNTFYKTINAGSQFRSMSAEEQSYIIINQPGMLVVAEVETDETVSMVSTNRTINYQLNQLYTGGSGGKGTVQVGSSIDTRTLPNGIYILSLMDGNRVETHKVVIK